MQGRSPISCARSRKTMVIDKTCTAMNDPFGVRMALYQAYVSPWKADR